MAKILMHTLGSSGDFNPFIALAFELQKRGHHIHFVVNPANAAKLQGLGFQATGAGPDLNLQSDFMRRLLAPSQRKPINILFQELLIPSIVPAFETLEPFCREADLFISHSIQLAAPALAQKTGVRWISAVPPTSCYRTSEILPSIAWKNCPAFLCRFGWSVAYEIFRHLDDLANEEYQKLGIAPRRNVILDGSYSHLLTLGLWSPAYFPRPIDWPDWFQVGGYARWDAPADSACDTGTLPKGDGPLIVFTLGSSVVNDPRGFYEAALEAVRPTSWRALLIGAPDDLGIPEALRDRVVTTPYAPYTDVFPRASAIVHQGGVGTTQAACYYGVPSLVVPRGFDQFENAAHIQRNGWGLRLLPKHLSPELLRRRLTRLLGQSEVGRSVADLGARMRTEPGVSRSVDIIESILQDEAVLASSAVPCSSAYAER